MDFMPQPKLDTADPPVLTLDEAERLLRACEGRGFTDRRDNAMVRLFLDAGLRLGEMVNIETKDTDMRSKSVRVHGKTRPRGFMTCVPSIDRPIQPEHVCD
jgi:site-specific recombinase XerC